MNSKISSKNKKCIFFHWQTYFVIIYLNTLYNILINNIYVIIYLLLNLNFIN